MEKVGKNPKRDAILNELDSIISAVRLLRIDIISGQNQETIRADYNDAITKLQHIKPNLENFKYT